MAHPRSDDTADLETRLTARSWRSLSVTATAVGVLLLVLTGADIRATLGAAVCSLLVGIGAAVRTWCLRTRPSAAGRPYRLPIGSLGLLAVIGFTCAIGILAMISLLG
jgi:hypothetical protein